MVTPNACLSTAFEVFSTDFQNVSFSLFSEKCSVLVFICFVSLSVCLCAVLCMCVKFVHLYFVLARWFDLTKKPRNEQFKSNT